ncbi:hypothetical protein VCRA2122O12_40155 [Vibrio crassostreae]|nr:hypothetical protein VCRA2119O46_130050 [Vibrio crassostreae]CAK1800982.1 hypothetical protein VCRA2117O428_170048 [Vibrio crassostreae]CAK1805617.1 hypothetical protein VCRA2117O328_170010 [Vibrio crassostreae]CAK1815281.1 hypothetical protein VCRA2113O414_180058 [Vibrio crassostreae]CAK2013450.1 hypothetical protein VCRA2113O138_300005 [Vibrio crassostreae]
MCLATCENVLKYLTSIDLLTFFMVQTTPMLRSFINYSY